MNLAGGNNMIDLNTAAYHLCLGIRVLLTASDSQRPVDGD
jgi:hypothetical protein